MHFHTISVKIILCGVRNVNEDMCIFYVSDPSEEKMYTQIYWFSPKNFMSRQRRRQTWREHGGSQLCRAEERTYTGEKMAVGRGGALRVTRKMATRLFDIFMGTVTGR